MNRFLQMISFSWLMAFGVFSVEPAYAKVTQGAAEMKFKEEIALGNLQSPIEVYVFSDWKCMACRQVEAIVLSSSDALMRDAKVFFIDITAHRESLDYTPYNLSFLMNNKAKYFKLRGGLMELSANEKSPEESQIQALAAMYGVKYEPLNYSEITSALKFFSNVKGEFGIDTAPTVVVINAFNEKGKKFVGTREITESNLVGAVKALREGISSSSAGN